MGIVPQPHQPVWGVRQPERLVVILAGCQSECVSCSAWTLQGHCLHRRCHLHGWFVGNGAFPAEESCFSSGSLKEEGCREPTLCSREAWRTKAQRLRDESCVTDCSLVNSTLCVAVPRQISLWKGMMSACQPNPTWCLPPALVVGFCSRDIVYSETNKYSHWNTAAGLARLSDRMLRDLKVLSKNMNQSRDYDRAETCHS